MRIRAGLGAIAAGALIFSGAVAAQASETPGAETVTLNVSEAMVPAGFDPAVAEANGYKIVTDSTGEQRSVPVSAEAIAFEERLASSALKARTTWVQGPCGNSWINAVSKGNSKFISTGYVVPRPVIAKLWIVQVWGWSGLPSFSWSGPSGASWSSSWSFSGGGDFANVLPGSNVVMNNGTVCVSGSPGENFHS
ncbi:hypothetical protein ACPPVW_18160 [Leifsonia sp. McL0607]|uniref:hypothetical protein n=1 Tax=Leifsonia sp. McL0607 TaxID=3415672 RepID=UPI003CF7938F